MCPFFTDISLNKVNWNNEIAYFLLLQALATASGRPNNHITRVGEGRDARASISRLWGPIVRTGNIQKYL
jgi:hypothetical protein